MIDINSEKKSQYQNILSDEAISFLEKVCSTFENTRQEILKNRVKMQNDISSGKRLSFPKDKKIREGNLPDGYDASLLSISPEEVMEALETL